MLAGYHVPERGAEVEVYGERLALGSPSASHAAGLRFIHQDLGLVDALDVAENLTLTSVSTMRWISQRRESSEVKQVLAKYNLGDIGPRQPVGTLRPYQKSMLAIARAVEDGLDRRGILVLDEPTASLPPNEVQRLMDLIRDLKTRGVSILYVSHKLPEVFTIADEVCVLRDGQVVARRHVAELDHDSLVELILGRALTRVRDDGNNAGSTPLLTVKGLAGATAKQVDLTVDRGEVVGLTGVIGSGYESVLKLVFGAVERASGIVRLGDSVIPSGDPSSAIQRGLAYAPPDRRTSGAITGWTLRENLTLPAVRGNGPLNWLTAGRERRDVAPWIARLDVKPTDPDAPFMTLSGGNQQKVVIARWLRCGAQAFLLDEPTAGVDAGAKQAVHAELRGAARAGAAVVIASSDMEELCEACDRILVMGNGRVASSIRTPAEPDQVFVECLRAGAAA